MYSQKLFTTGQFAQLHHINKRTLHYYDQIGLFSPDYHGKNHYRYYTYQQSPELEMILTFRDLGMSIDEILRYRSQSSPELLEHVFERVVRGEETAVKGILGSGLGMSIVKKITDALGGEIHISSMEGAGTCVTAELEFKVAEGSKKIDNIEEFRQQARMKLREKKIVLVAEDRLDNREILVTYLEELGYETRTADNGETAVDMFMDSEEGFYKAILMDIEMPVLNGYQATMMIRGLNRTDRDVPVIAMTANVFADDKAEADKVGMNDYVTKPLKREKLLDVLKTWIDDRK